MYQEYVFNLAEETEITATPILRIDPNNCICAMLRDTRTALEVNIINRNINKENIFSGERGRGGGCDKQ